MEAGWEGSFIAFATRALHAPPTSHKKSEETEWHVRCMNGMNDERMNGSFLPSSVPRVVAHSSLRPSITAYEISTGKILNHKLCLRYVRY